MDAKAIFEALVSELGAAAIRGLQRGGLQRGGLQASGLQRGGVQQRGARADDTQSPALRSPRAVLACAKHYVGDGGTSYEPRDSGGRRTLLDQGDTRVDEPTLRRIHLPAYVAAIEAGVGSIMVSYNS